MERGRGSPSLLLLRERVLHFSSLERERESPSLLLLQSSSSTKTNEMSQNKSANPNGRAINAPIGPYRKRQSMGPYDE